MKCRSNHVSSPSILALGEAGAGAGLEIVLVFADALAALDPAFMILGSPLIGQLNQSRPVLGMVVSEFNIAAHGFHQLLGRHMLSQVFVELELGSGVGVDEWGDQFEESHDHEWH